MSFVCTEEPQALFYNQQGGARACFTAVIELRDAAGAAAALPSGHGSCRPPAAPLALDVSLAYAASGARVDDQSILTLLDPETLAPFDEGASPQMLGTPRSGGGDGASSSSGGTVRSCCCCTLRARVTDVSRTHAHQRFALLVRAKSAAALEAAGLPSEGAAAAPLLRGLLVGAVLVKSKINPPRHKDPLNKGKRTAPPARAGAAGAAARPGHAAGSGAHQTHQRKRAALDVLSSATPQGMTAWGNAAVEVLRRVQWLPVGFEQAGGGGGGGTGGAAMADGGVQQQDIARPIYKCPSCNVFKRGDGDAFDAPAPQHSVGCDITALLRSAGVQQMPGERGSTAWVDPQPLAAHPAAAAEGGGTGTVGGAVARAAPAAGARAAAAQPDGLDVPDVLGGEESGLAEAPFEVPLAPLAQPTATPVAPALAPAPAPASAASGAMTIAEQLEVAAASVRAPQAPQAPSQAGGLGLSCASLLSTFSWNSSISRELVGYEDGFDSPRGCLSGADSLSAFDG